MPSLLTFTTTFFLTSSGATNDAHSPVSGILLAP
jgi:hypothetical protein